MFTKTAVVQVARPPDEVFEFVADARNRPLWDDSVDSEELTSAEPIGVGTTVRTTLHSMGREYVLTWEIVEFEPPSRQTIESTSGPFPTTLEYQLTEQDGGTLVHFSVTGRPSGFLRLLQPLLARNTQKNLDRAFPRLKRQLETGVPENHHERTQLMITDREQRQIDRANSSGKTPVVFIHGLWLLPSSWDNWVGLFEENGYAGVTPSWPDDPESIEEARANPEVFARKTLKRVADHTAAVIGQLDKKPAVMGHSTGGLLTQMMADRGLSAASVAIDPGPFRGVLPLPLSALKSASPVLRNPLNRGRAVTLTFDQFKYGWANALDDTEARQLYDTYHVPAPGVALLQMANANVNPFTEAKVDPRNPDRGPLLIIEGEKDHTVPWAIAHAAYKRQKHNASVTEITRIPNRGHSLTIDSGWREVAQTALDFVKRFA